MTTVETQPFAQQSAPRRLKHRGIDIGVKKNLFCALGTAAIAGVDALALDINTVGTRHADTQPLVV